MIQYVTAPITDAIASCMQTKQDVAVQSTIQVRALQTPFVATRCSKIVKGKKCGYRVSSGKCGKGHQTTEYPPFKMIGVWATFLDAETSSSVQRRCFIRTEAFIELTGIEKKELLKMNGGYQEALANNMKDGIYVAKFIVNKKFIQLVEFVQ